jgi:molybdenum cofactor cytidylyltransferase
VQLIRRHDVDALDTLAPGAILCHDVRDPAQTRTVVLRKGRQLDAADLVRLRGLNAGEVHLLVPESGDLLEDEAAARLAAAVAPGAIRLTEPHYGQVNLISRLAAGGLVESLPVHRALS